MTSSYWQDERFFEKSSVCDTLYPMLIQMSWPFQAFILDLFFFFQSIKGWKRLAFGFNSGWWPSFGEIAKTSGQPKQIFDFWPNAFPFTNSSFKSRLMLKKSQFSELNHIFPMQFFFPVAQIFCISNSLKLEYHETWEYILVINSCFHLWCFFCWDG